MRVLGIDPGSRVTGFGVVERVDGGVLHVAHGTLRPPQAGSLADRLAYLYDGLGDVVRRYEPERAVVEQVFVSAGARSALVLGQARGAALVAVGRAALPVDEISAREVKKAVVGTGSASKQQVQEMVKRLLGLDARPASDAADALAAAICRAHAGPLAGLERRRRPSRRARTGARRAVLRRAP